MKQITIGSYDLQLHLVVQTSNICELFSKTVCTSSIKYYSTLVNLKRFTYSRWYTLYVCPYDLICRLSLSSPRKKQKISQDA